MSARHHRLGFAALFPVASETFLRRIRLLKCPVCSTLFVPSLSLRMVFPTHLTVSSCSVTPNGGGFPGSSQHVLLFTRQISIPALTVR